MRLDDFALAVFDSSLRDNFNPLSLTKPAFDFTFGTCSLLERIEQRVSANSIYLFAPDYLENLTKEEHPHSKVNCHVSGKILLINSLISDRPEIWKFLESSTSDAIDCMYFDSSGVPVFGLMEEVSSDAVASGFRKFRKNCKKIPAEIDSQILFRFPWELVEKNARSIADDFSNRYERQSAIGGDCDLRGDRFSISPSAEVERFVTLDSRNGPIIIEDESCVESSSRLTGPCFVGKQSIVKSGRIGEGTTISNSCRVAGEIEESILFGHTNKNHEGFVGHSIVGSWVNLGALTTTSDLKNTYGDIKVRVRGKPINTNSIKVGSFIGDMAKTGIGTMISTGKTIGASAHVLSNVLEDIPSFTIHNEPNTKDLEMYIDSAIRTQNRMLSRRGKSMSDGYVSMMRALFRMTRKDRTSNKVSRGKFRSSS